MLQYATFHLSSLFAKEPVYRVQNEKGVNHKSLTGAAVVDKRLAL